MSARKKKDESTSRASRTAEDQDDKPRRKRRSNDQDHSSEDDKQRSAGAAAIGTFFSRLLPIVSAVCGFVAIVLVYRVAFPWIAADKSTSEVPLQAVAEPTYAEQDPNVYRGVEDKWAGGWFASGSEELDKQTKAYCDALSLEGNNARANAQVVYNAIVQSDYKYRSENEQITGDNWAEAAAKQFFSTGAPAEGIGGSGDEYEFAAATAYCLRYFGYNDAMAVPIIRSDTQEGSAVCLVTDENGNALLCDPAMGTDGWFRDRSQYKIVVDNIGQDLSKVQAMGLTVADSQGSEETSADGTVSDSYSTYNDYGTDSSYDSGSMNTTTGYNTGYDTSSDYTSTSTGTSAGYDQY